MKDITDYMDGESWVYVRRSWRGYIWTVVHPDFGFSVGRSFTFNRASEAAGLKVAYPEDHIQQPIS